MTSNYKTRQGCGWILALLLWAFIFFGENCSAEVLGISLDQTVVAFDAYPGETQEFSLVVTNISAEKQKMLFDVEDMMIEDQNKMTLIPEANDVFGMKNWIKSQETEWVLNPEESRRISFSLFVPFAAPVGSHFSAILLRAYPEAKSEDQQKTIVSPRIGVHILVNVKGEVFGDGKIKKFSAPIFFRKKVDFQVEYQNEGNIHYIPYGGISLKNIWGQEKENLKFSKHFVFPGKQYSFELNWSGGSFWEAYRAEAFFIDGDGEQHLNRRFIFGEGFLLLIFVWVVSLMLMTRWAWKERKKTKRTV